MARCRAPKALLIALLPALLAVPAVAPGSAAARAFVLSSSGGSADVAVDEAGTGHVVWSERGQLVYCRLPRRATACAVRRTFQGFGENRILARSPGEVVILSGGQDGTVAYRSTDGGSTFADPRQIGSVPPDDAAFGPGAFDVSMVGTREDSLVYGAFTSFYQAAPLDSLAPTRVDLGDLEHPTIGFVDPTTPLVAGDGGGNISFRAYGGSGDHNDPSMWKPSQRVAEGFRPKLAGGARGLFVSYVEGARGGREILRRYDQTTGTFGAARFLSGRRGASNLDLRQRDLHQDAGGRLHAAWVDEDDRRSPIRYRSSADGTTWEPVRSLESPTDKEVRMQIGAGRDGGGWIVYEDGDPLKAVAFEPSDGDGGGGACVPVVRFGEVEAAAKLGCLRKVGARYVSADPVRVNGLDLLPSGSATITIDPHQREISGRGAVEVRAGNVVLDRGSFTWPIPRNGSNAATFRQLEKFRANLLGFPVVGEARLDFADHGSRLPAHLQLPRAFGGINADVTLRADNTTPLGLRLDGLRLHVDEAPLGSLRLRNLDVTYVRDPAIFEGRVQVLLPPFYVNAPRIDAGFGFAGGRFQHAEAAYTFDEPGLPLWKPWLYMRSVGFALSVDPTKIAGGAILTGGPTIAGTSAISIDALPPAKGFSFTFGRPAIMQLTGKLNVVEFEIGSGFAEYQTSGLLTFGGGVDYSFGGIASVFAGIPPGGGFLDLRTGRFALEADAGLCLPAAGRDPAGRPVCRGASFGGKLVISSTGVAACGDLGAVSLGAGYKWGQEFELLGEFGACDLGEFRPAVNDGRLRRSQAGPSFRLRPGLPQAAVLVEGMGGAPRVTLRAPNGEQISSPGDQNGFVRSGRFVSYSVPHNNLTYFGIADPPAGEWQLSTEPGSAPIGRVRTADGLPEPSVTARVSGRGARRALTYRIKPIPGQRVVFSERGGRSGAVLGSATAPRGTLRFRPAPGPGGRRRVVAIVESNGIPRKARSVAHYVAPPPPRVGPARNVRIRRGPRSVLVRWGRARHAALYEVRVRLRDGTNRMRTTRQRSVVLRDIQRTDRGAVSVRGIRVDGARGAAVTARVKPPRRSRGRR